MSFLRAFIKLSVIIGCAVGSFGAIQLYMPAEAEVSQVMVRPVKADPIAAKLAEYGDLNKAMSPVYPTIKYSTAQLAFPVVKTPAKAKVAARSAHKMPMQIAYVPDRGV